MPPSVPHRVQARAARGPVPARSLPPSTLPTILERRTTLMRTSSLEDLRFVRDRGTSPDGGDAGDGAAQPSAAALLQAMPQSLPASPSGGALAGGAFDPFLASPFDSDRNAPSAGHAVLGAASGATGDRFAPAGESGEQSATAAAAPASAAAAPERSVSPLTAELADEPFAAWRSLCGWRAPDQQWSFDDMCLRNAPGSPAGGSSIAMHCSMDDLHVPLPPASVFSLTDGALGGSLRLQSSAPPAATARDRFAAPSAHPAAAAARAADGGRAASSPTSPWRGARGARPPVPALEHDSLIDFDALARPSGLASPEPALRSLDDLDLLGKPQDLSPALWLPEPCSPERPVSRAGCGYDRSERASPGWGAGVGASAAACASLPPPLRLSSVAVATRAGMPPSCVGSDADDGEGDEPAHTARISPPSSPSGRRSWQRQRSIGHGGGSGGAGGGSAHTDGLRALRSTQHPGAMFHSGRSIAAEWLQVPAVPLLPGTQCHDDAMVPEATGWARRHGSGGRAAAGRSRSVASRNMSHTSLALPGDVQKLGVASSLASETSEWYASQREGGASATGWGARGKGSSGCAWGLGDGGEGAGAAAPLGLGVPEGRALDWGLDGSPQE